MSCGTNKLRKVSNKTIEDKMKKRKTSRDVEIKYSNAEFVAKLRRLADAIEKGKRFAIQIKNERIYIPVHAEFTI